MATTVFPAASSSGNLKQTFTATASSTLYAATASFTAGTYTVTCPSAAKCIVDFYNGSTFLAAAKTVTGTVDVNLASAADRIKFYTNTSGTSIGILLTGSPVSASVSGTLDTITSSGTYTGTGTEIGRAHV